MHFYHVLFRGNFLDNGRYQVSTNTITVVAENYEQAIDIANENQMVVFEYFKERRDRHGKRILRKSETSIPKTMKGYGCERPIAIGGFPTVLLAGKFRQVHSAELPTLKTKHPEWFI